MKLRRTGMVRLSIGPASPTRCALSAWAGGAFLLRPLKAVMETATAGGVGFSREPEVVCGMWMSTLDCFSGIIS